jgi:hypothetical protein
MTAEQLKTLEDRLWEAANNLRQGAGVKASALLLSNSKNCCLLLSKNMKQPKTADAPAKSTK